MKDLKTEHTRLYNLILERQRRLGEFVYDNRADSFFDSFKWSASPEKFDFWQNLYIHSQTDEDYSLFYERYPTPRKWYIKIDMHNSEEINNYAGSIYGYIPSGSGFVACNLDLARPTYVTYGPLYEEEIGLYEFRKIVKQFNRPNQTKNNTIMWKKINKNKLPAGVVVARRGSVVQSGHLIITQEGMVVLVSSSPSKNREALIEWPEAYMKAYDLLEMPFEASAKDILTKEIANSSSGFNGVIVHPKLADRLIEEGAISPNMLKSGYCFIQRVGTGGAVYHNVYVSSDNMQPEQVIVF